MYPIHSTNHCHACYLMNFIYIPYSAVPTYSGSCNSPQSLMFLHACNTSFDRCCNTLLVSLNNRISIRDTYDAHKAVDCQFTTFHSARSHNKHHALGTQEATEMSDQLFFIRSRRGIAARPRMSLKWSSVSRGDFFLLCI